MHALHFISAMPQPCARNPTFATLSLSLGEAPPATFETHKEAPASCLYFLSFFSNFHCSIVVHFVLFVLHPFFLQIYFPPKCPKGAVLLFVLFFY